MIIIEYQLIKDPDGRPIATHLEKHCKNEAEATKFMLEIINDIPTDCHIKIMKVLRK